MASTLKMHDVIADRNARALCICVYAEKLVSPGHERIDGDCNLTPGRCRRIVGPPLSTRIIAAKNVNRSAYSFRVTAGQLTRNITRVHARETERRSGAESLKNRERNGVPYMAIQCRDIRRREPAAR